MRRTIVTSIIALLIGGVGTYLFFPESAKSNEAAQPGNADDPLITKSYLEQYLKQSGTPTGAAGSSIDENKVRQIITDELAKIPQPATGSNTGAAGGNTTSSTNTTVQTLTVVQLQAGQTLYAGVGTEIIVRSGKTIAVSNDDNGIPDVTSGKDISAGTAVELNHMLLFPREGRGIKPDVKNETQIYVMVRGSYSIMKPDGTKVSP